MLKDGGLVVYRDWCRNAGRDGRQPVNYVFAINKCCCEKLYTDLAGTKRLLMFFTEFSVDIAAGVQVDLINLLDLEMLRDNNDDEEDDDDEGLELAAVPTEHDIRPEVDGEEGDKLDGIELICPFTGTGVNVAACSQKYMYVITNILSCTTCEEIQELNVLCTNKR